MEGCHGGLPCVTVYPPVSTLLKTLTDEDQTFLLEVVTLQDIILQEYHSRTHPISAPSITVQWSQYHHNL